MYSLEVVHFMQLSLVRHHADSTHIARGAPWAMGLPWRTSTTGCPGPHHGRKASSHCNACIDLAIGPPADTLSPVGVLEGCLASIANGDRRGYVKHSSSPGSLGSNRCLHGRSSSTHRNQHHRARRALPCLWRSWIPTYLGLTLSDTRLRREDLHQFCYSLDKRLRRWKAKLIALSGRIELVGTTLSAMAIYWLMAIAPPLWFIKMVDKLRWAFLWAADEASPMGKCLVRWRNVCRLRELGGLGIHHHIVECHVTSSYQTLCIIKQKHPSIESVTKA